MIEDKLTDIIGVIKENIGYYVDVQIVRESTVFRVKIKTTSDKLVYAICFETYLSILEVETRSSLLLGAQIAENARESITTTLLTSLCNRPDAIKSHITDMISKKKGKG